MIDMAAFDHFALACQNLEEGVDFVEAMTGVRAAPGGPHPGVGTHNALLSLGTDVYLEIIAVDPNQDAPPRPRPFGIDEHRGPRLAAFAIHPSQGETIESVSETIRNHGTDPGPVVAMNRVKPDGEEISWRLTLSSNQRMVPFVIDWGDTPNPATITPKGCLLTEVRGSDPQLDRTVALHQQLGLDIKVSEGSSWLEIILQRPDGGTTSLSQFSA